LNPIQHILDDLNIRARSRHQNTTVAHLRQSIQEWNTKVLKLSTR